MRTRVGHAILLVLVVVTVAVIVAVTTQAPGLLVDLLDSP